MTKRFGGNALEIHEDILPTASPSVIFSLISSMVWTPVSKHRPWMVGILDQFYLSVKKCN